MKKIIENPNGFAKEITTKVHGKDFETPTMMLTYSFRLNNPRPWKKIPNCTVMTNAYDIFQNGKLENRIREKGIHSELELNGEICAMDSGGYQFISRGEGEQIDPLKVIELQNQSKVDIAVCLDYPILQDFTPEKSQKLTQQSLENIVKMEYNERFVIEISFESWAQNETYANYQRDAINVTEGQMIQEGDIIGMLLYHGEGTHIDFSMRDQDEVICPYQYFSNEAKTIFDALWDKCGYGDDSWYINPIPLKFHVTPIKKQKI